MKKSFFEELWPQYDAAGYSLYFSNYKYNDENTVLYMTGETACIACGGVT